MTSRLLLFNCVLYSLLKGWKKENVAEKGDTFRVVYIDYNDPPYCRKKVRHDSIAELVELML